MTLQVEGRVDILRAAQRDAMAHADVWVGIAKYLETLIEDEESRSHSPSSTQYDADGIQFTYTSEAGQGYNLSRGWSGRDETVRDPNATVGSSIRSGRSSQ